MSMSRKDFEAIAAVIAGADLREMVDDSQIQTSLTPKRPLAKNEADRLRKRLALMMADTLVSQSDTFDPIRFVKACGVSSRDCSSLAIRQFSPRLQARLASQR